MTTECIAPARPDWRWQAVVSGQAAKAFPTSPSPSEALELNKVRIFAEALQKGDTEMAAVFEYLSWAHSIYEAGGFNRNLAEAALLTGDPEDDVADDLGIPRRSLAVYGFFFFDVRPYLDDEEWIEEKVLVPASTAPIAELYNAYRMKKVGYTYGWRAVRSCLYPMEPSGLPDDIGEQLLDSFVEALCRAQSRVT